MLKINKNNTFKFSIYGDSEKEFDRIHENFFPIRFENFITICIDNKYQYWQEVIDLVISVLDRNKIAIVVFSCENNANLMAHLNINKLSIRHAAYLLNRSAFHFCSEDWSLSLAENNKNNVLYVGDGLQSLTGKNTNFVNDFERPEIIAKNIFEKLNISQEIRVNTEIIGPSYGVKCLEMVPDFEINSLPQIDKDSLIGIRCDLFENWDFVARTLAMGLNSVVTSKTLPTFPIASFISGIKCINLLASKDIDEDHLKKVIEAGVNVKLFCYNECSEDIKRKFFDFENIMIIEDWSNKNLDKLSKLKYDTKLKSKRLIVSKGKTFLSVFHLKQNLPVDNKKGNMLLEALDDKDFLTEADLFYYYNN